MLYSNGPYPQVKECCVPRRASAKLDQDATRAFKFIYAKSTPTAEVELKKEKNITYKQKRV